MLSHPGHNQNPNPPFYMWYNSGDTKAKLQIMSPTDMLTTNTNRHTSSVPLQITVSIRIGIITGIQYSPNSFRTPWVSVHDKTNITNLKKVNINIRNAIKSSKSQFTIWKMLCSFHISRHMWDCKHVTFLNMLKVDNQMFHTQRFDKKIHFTKTQKWVASSVLLCGRHSKQMPTASNADQLPN